MVETAKFVGVCSGIESDTRVCERCEMDFVQQYGAHGSVESRGYTPHGKKQDPKRLAVGHFFRGVHPTVAGNSGTKGLGKEVV